MAGSSAEAEDGDEHEDPPEDEVGSTAGSHGSSVHLGLEAAQGAYPDDDQELLVPVRSDEGATQHVAEGSQDDREDAQLLEAAFAEPTPLPGTSPGTRSRGREYVSVSPGTSPAGTRTVARKGGRVVAFR